MNFTFNLFKAKCIKNVQVLHGYLKNYSRIYYPKNG